MDSQAPLRVLQKKRTTNFREDETKMLIQLWGSPQIQNKLYLTHRKAPVMRLLAANMQHRGFYRTPDEIKTRLRNLKCLYHRIKRSVQTGVGVGTVDPDWPHYKAMDDILSKRNTNRPQDLYKDNIFEGPRCEDIKQEIIDDEIDINDDMESYTTNSLNGSDDAEFEDESHHMPPLTPSPPSPEKTKENAEPIKIAPKPNQPQPQPDKPTLSNNIPIPISTHVRTNTTTTPSLPFPLLILNGLPNQNQVSAPAKKEGMGGIGSLGQEDVSALLKDLLQVQKENLEVEKQRLEVDKQTLEFHRLVGTQLLTLLPMIGGFIQRVAFPNNNNDEEKNIVNNEDASKKSNRKRSCPDSGLDILKDSKILRNVLEDGIKKYMLEENGEESFEKKRIKIKSEVDEHDASDRN
ncbi:uncharacterized protein [Leptinotarsa decemlineata]|uniref:uncharacterized protein n=1 Tax=Leptinotarsa decemlineata TaxID=7539 RepID=UPI003D306AAA